MTRQTELNDDTPVFKNRCSNVLNNKKLLFNRKQQWVVHSLTSHTHTLSSTGVSLRKRAWFSLSRMLLLAQPSYMLSADVTQPITAGVFIEGRPSASRDTITASIHIPGHACSHIMCCYVPTYIAPLLPPSSSVLCSVAFLQGVLNVLQ